jgi:Na+/proline symporter
VVVLGGFAQSLVPYTSDMAVVQRYMAVPDEARAKKAIWTNAIAVIPATLLFFGIGTALFRLYANHPDRLDPAFRTDAIFPLFIARELPVGVAGLVVAGVFAAASPPSPPA